MPYTISDDCARMLADVLQNLGSFNYLAMARNGFMQEITAQEQANVRAGLNANGTAVTAQPAAPVPLEQVLPAGVVPINRQARRRQERLAKKAAAAPAAPTPVAG